MKAITSSIWPIGCKYWALSPVVKVIDAGEPVVTGPAASMPKLVKPSADAIKRGAFTTTKPAGPTKSVSESPEGLQQTGNSAPGVDARGCTATIE